MEDAFCKAYQKSAGLAVAENPSPGGYKSLVFSELIDFGDYDEWRNGFAASPPLGRKEAPFNSLPVYGAAWCMAVEATEMAARLAMMDVELSLSTFVMAARAMSAVMTSFFILNGC